MKKLSFFILISFIFIGFMSAQTITVTSPHAGDIWYKGNTYTIRWENTGNTGVNVKINIFKDAINPANFIEQLKGPNSGSKSWTIPSTYDNGTYYIRIKGVDSSWNDVGVFGDSGAFTISEPLELITTMKMTGVPVKRPDLKISIIPNPVSPVTGDLLTIIVKVENIGPGESVPCKARIRRGGELISTWNVSALKQGEYKSKMLNWTLPGAGYVNLYADVDHERITSDSNYGNNVVRKKLIVKGP